MVIFKKNPLTSKGAAAGSTGCREKISCLGRRPGNFHINEVNPVCWLGCCLSQAVPDVYKASESAEIRVTSRQKGGVVSTRVANRKVVAGDLLG